MLNVYIRKVSINFELSTFATFHPYWVQSIRVSKEEIANTVGNFVEISQSHLLTHWIYIRIFIFLYINEKSGKRRKTVKKVWN